MFFFFLPVGVDFEARRYPTVTFALMGANLLVYLISWAVLMAGGEEGLLRFLFTWGLVPAHTHAYAYLTSMFTHAGLFHFLGNMVYLFLFGACIEDILGRGQFLAFYLIGGFCSSIAHVLLTTGPSAEIPCVGASGAISACLGAFLLLRPKTRINFRYWGLFVVRYFAGDVWIPAWVVLSFWFARDLLSLAAESGEAAGGIAFAAHVGGFVAGLAVAAVWRPWHARHGGDDQPSPEVVRAVPARAALPANLYLWQDGAQTGPYTADQVRDMLSLGSISEDAVYWSEGMPDWRPARELAGS